MEKSSNKGQNQGQSQNQSNQLFGESYTKAQPNEKIEHVLGTIENQGFNFQPGKRESLISEIKTYLDKNPKLSRIDLFKHTFQKVDSSYVEESNEQNHPA